MSGRGGLGQGPVQGMGTWGSALYRGGQVPFLGGVWGHDPVRRNPPQ